MALARIEAARWLGWLGSEICRELGIRPVTLYRYVGPQGQLREQGEKVLAT